MSFRASFAASANSIEEFILQLPLSGTEPILRYHKAIRVIWWQLLSSFPISCGVSGKPFDASQVLTFRKFSTQSSVENPSGR